jgi:nicotinamidase-related amidase
MMIVKALICIDVQNDYFSGGAFALSGAEAASSRIAILQKEYRARGEMVVHVQHQAEQGELPFLLRGDSGSDFYELTGPVKREAIFKKRLPNAFNGTGLEDHLRSNNIAELSIVGFMSQVCVNSTARSGLESGFKIKVYDSACAASSLQYQNELIDAEDVHKSSLASLAFLGCELSD